MIRATARLRFHAGFTLSHAAGIVPNLHALGISQRHASLLLKARPGFTHRHDRRWPAGRTRPLRPCIGFSAAILPRGIGQWPPRGARSRSSLVHFHTYRLHAGPAGPADADRRAMAWAPTDAPAPPDALAGWRDGRMKQAVIARLLALRARKPSLFAERAYRPLPLAGRLAAHAIGYMRQFQGRAVVVPVSRLAAWLLPEGGLPLVPAAACGGTAVMLPRSPAGRRLNDVLAASRPGGGEILLDRGGSTARMALGNVLPGLPVAVLEAR